MRYAFHIVDVFTGTRFGGNPLAVLPEARGLDTAQMQQITREFNFSESTFVLPASDPANTRQVRIFTPDCEVPFAGHPNVGTAFALAATGVVPGRSGEVVVRFEELAGVVPVAIRFEGGAPRSCELTAPEALSTGATASAGEVAAAFGLAAADVDSAVHPPTVASVGLPFLMVSLTDAGALDRIAPDLGAVARLCADVGAPGIHLYARAPEDAAWDLQARMFAPGAGVPEDPATGSANCALAALLASLDPLADGELAWSIAQGIEMGRPSRLEARVEKRAGALGAIRIGGESVMVAEGTIEV